MPFTIFYQKSQKIQFGGSGAHIVTPILLKFGVWIAHSMNNHPIYDFNRFILRFEALLGQKPYFLAKEYLKTQEIVIKLNIYY